MLKIIFPIIAYIFLTLSISSAVEIDFSPLGLYLSRVPEALGTGGIETETRQGAEDNIYHPARLPDRKGILSAGYESEIVWRPVEDDWKGTNAGSTTKRLNGLIPLAAAPIIGDASLSFKLASRDTGADAVYKPNGATFGYSRKYETKTAALGIRPFSMLRVGGGVEIYNDGNKDSPFYEVVFQPAEELFAGYREYQRELRLNSYLYKDGHLATLPFVYSKGVKEVRMGVVIPDYLSTEIILEEGEPQNREVKLTLHPTKTLSISYIKSDIVMDFDSDINIDGSYGGRNKTFIEQHSEGYGAAIKTASGMQYLLNIRKSLFDAEGAGKLVNNSVLSFWESLLAGERFFNYGFNMKSAQYHIGVEKPAAKGLTIRGGLQYIVAEPAGQIDHWTPYPTIKIGKLDEEIIGLKYKRAELGVLALGFSYRFGSFEIIYGMGQIVPLKIEKEKEADGAVTETEYPAGRGEVNLGNLWESIKESPGGNLQLMRIDWHF
jgi:hypothetical protein